MGKLVRLVLSFVIIAALLLAGLYTYVKPTQSLNLEYSELSVRNKLVDILKNRKLEVVLSEPEVNDLLKKAVAEHPQVQPDVRITGAQFSLQGSQWVADVNLLYKEKWAVGTRLYFTMRWQEPDLVAVHTATQIREMTLPADWFQLQPLHIPLNSYLPKPAGVGGITFENHEVKVALKLR